MGDDFATGFMLGQDNKGNSGFGGNGDWFAWVIIFALIFGIGGRGNNWGGNSGGGCGCGSSCATVSDLAAGFNNSSVLSNLNDLALGQAGIQQTLCQGFSGVNATVNAGTNTLSSAICNLGYNTQSGFNALSAQLADCCCQTQRAIDAVNYNAAKNACDIQNTIHNTTRDIIDSQREGTTAILNFLTNEKISSLQADKASLTAQLSQNAQTDRLLGAINRTPVPAYMVANPYAAYNYGCYNNCGCGCGC